MYISVNKTQLFFDIYGSKLTINPDSVDEKPILIVLHGGHGFADHTLYVEFWSQFSDLAQVIFLDQRGCGRSNFDTPHEWNLKQWADDLYGFLQILNIKNPIIAGISMGGHVMCEFISSYPDIPKGLIFCNTEAQFNLDKVCAKFYELGGEIPAKACRAFYLNPENLTLDDYLKYCIPYYAHNPYSKEELNRCIKNPEVFIHFCRQQMLKFNYLNELHKIQCPTLLLVGQDSCLHLVEAAHDMAEKINPKLLNMTIFEKAGSPVYKDMPHKTLQTVKKFLMNL